jgi:hypothetical protein
MHPAAADGCPPTSCGSRTEQVLDCTAMSRLKARMPFVSDAESLENKAKLMANMAAALAMFGHPDAVEAGLLDYVFGYDPQEDLALLSRPGALESATVFSNSESAVDVGTPTEGLADADFLVDIMLIPAACHGAFSYGVVCCRRHGVHHGCPSGESTFVRDAAVCRFCRNELTGEFFCVDRDFDMGLTSVVYRRELSSTGRVLMKMKFDTLALEKKDGIYNFADAARMQATALQNRFCPMCSAPPSRKCGCVLPLRRPRHSRDTATLLANSEQMTGNFVGEVLLTAFCSNIGKYFSTRMLSRNDTNPYLVIVQPTALHQTAIQLRLAAASPLQLEIPFLDSDGESLFVSDVVDGVEEAVENQSDFVGDTADSVFPLNSFDDRVEVDTDLALSAVSGLDTIVPVDNTLDPVPSELYSLPQEFPESFGNEDVVEDVLQWHVDEEIKQSISQLFSPLLSDGSDVGAATAVDEADSSSSPGVSQNTRNIAANRIEAQRAARMELRRHKNRAAAARSNARRKERNESLRRNLAYVRERFQVLRGMEKVVREENNGLKLQLRELL